MSRLSPAMKLLVAAVVVLVLGAGALVSVPILMIMGSTATLTEDSVDGTAACGPVARVAGRKVQLGEDQLTNAATIIRVGRSLDVPERGLVVAIATAMQESQLKNLQGGHLDSVGLFQQRDAWAPRSDRLDPATAARMFYTGGQQGQRGLLDIADWGSMSITDAAQAVQVSAFPFAYAKWESMAAGLVEATTGEDPLACEEDVVPAGLPAGEVGEMLRAALSMQGKYYVWGGTTCSGVDGSGLVVDGWRQAGYVLTVRTAAQMYNVSSPIPRGSEKPGDLIFGQFNTRVAGAGHVMIVVRPGLAVQAPSRGKVVRLTDYTTPYYSNWKIGRLKPSAFVEIPRAAAA